jgi:alkaline phosphatase
MTPRLAALTLTAFVSFSAAAAKAPKSVVLIVGDGMGTAHFAAARFLAGDAARFTKMPVTGLVMTHSADSIVTDSAAAATAMATGVKTNNKMVGVTPSGEALPTVLETAERGGRATGLVTTTDFWDATPAAFAAHVASRYDSPALVKQMLLSGAEIIAGGGAAKLGTDRLASLDDLARQYKFSPIRTAADLQSVKGPHLLAVFPTEPKEVDSTVAPLPLLAKWALERLSRDPDGFFLMLEHEGTDGSSHAAATPELEASLRSLNDTINVVLDFARTHPDVLVLVTGDHETGGLQIHPEKPALPLELRWSGVGHTGEFVPIFAQGPGAEGFTGLLDNTDIGKKLIKLMR